MHCFAIALNERVTTTRELEIHFRDNYADTAHKAVVTTSVPTAVNLHTPNALYDATGDASESYASAAR